MHGGLSQFRATLQRKRERAEAKDKGSFSRNVNNSDVNKEPIDYNFPKMSEAEFALFREKLKKERHKSRIRDLSLLILIVVIAMIFFTIVL